MGDVKLLPCPFCGHEGMLRSMKFGMERTNRYAVTCTACAIAIGWEDSDEKAIDRWNRRVENSLAIQRWISVNDRLPEPNVNVLVYAVGVLEEFIGAKTIAITSMSDTNRFTGYGKTEPYWLDAWQYFLIDYKITHWMPLPEEPEVES